MAGPHFKTPLFVLQMDALTIEEKLAMGLFRRIPLDCYPAEKVKRLVAEARLNADLALVYNNQAIRTLEDCTKASKW